jgi:hypothetical protein
MTDNVHNEIDSILYYLYDHEWHEFRSDNTNTVINIRYNSDGSAQAQQIDTMTLRITEHDIEAELLHDTLVSMILEGYIIQG